MLSGSNLKNICVLLLSVMVSTAAADSPRYVFLPDGRIVKISNNLAFPAPPGADRILFYDFSAGVNNWLTAGSGLTITGTTLTVNANDHEVLDGDVHTNTTAASILRGDLMYGFASDDLRRLAIGAANEFLKSDGTDVDWGTIDISDSTNLAVDTDHFLLDDDTIEMSPNQDTNLHVWQSSFLEQHDFTITEAGGTVTGNLEKEGTGDLTMYFSDEFTVLDCTAPLCTVDLTALVGTDASPAEAFVYIPQSTKTLTAAASWPAASVEHIRVANLVLQSAVTTGTDGALQNRNWNDFAFGITDPRGHGLHITQNLRANHAKWLSGVALSVTGDGTGTITLDNSAGVISQLHEQTFPALDMAGADDIHIVNQVVDEGGNYETSVNLVADVTHFVDGTDAGTAFTVNRYFNVVIWGVQNRTGETSHLMLNLPTGQYTGQSSATADVSNFSVRSIPSAFTGTGFLIGELTFRLTGGGSTWTLVEEKSLLGITPGTTAGGGVTTTATVFSDASFAIFDNADDSKRILFQASSIATGTDRTITMADANVDLADIATNTTHRNDNSQAHSDYLINNGNDTTTGVLTVEGLGTGGQTDYDLKVGDTNGTPTYGMIQIGNACIGRTSFKAGNIDLDGTIIFRNIAGPVTSEIEHVFVESTGDSTRFALAKAGVGNATYNSRSMLIAGPAPADTDYVKVTYWQTNNNIFDNLACDTSGVGADLGVQNDLEVEGDIFVDSIKESTTSAGISFNDFDITNVGDIAVDTVSADDGSSFSILNDWTNAGNTVADLGIVTTVNINGGTIVDITDIAVADGGTGASTAADARTNLGLIIGTDVQAWDAQLDTIATMSAGAAGALAVLKQAELEIIDDATVTTTELNYLDGTILGTAVASKVLAVDFNLDLDMGFGDRTSVGAFDGSVDLTALDTHSPVLLYSFERVLTASGSETTILSNVSGTAEYCDRAVTKGLLNTDQHYTISGYKGAGDIIDGSNPRTFNIWFKTVTAGSNRDIFSYGNGGTIREQFVVRLRSADDFQINYVTDFTRSADISAALDDQWHMLSVVVPNGAGADDVIIYVDAVDVSSTSSGTTAIDTDVTTNDVIVMALNPGGTNKATGCFDEISLTAAALTQPQLQTIFDKQRTKFIRGSDNSSVDVGDMAGPIVTLGSGTFGTLTVDSGSIADSSGAISFGDEAITTTGTLDFESVIIRMENIPVADPEDEGQLWNDAGNLAISAGS